MPRKYPDQTKHQAIGIPQIHNDISFTHHAAACRMNRGYPPHPPAYTYCIYTLCQNTGILWAFTRTFTPRPTVSVVGLCRRDLRDRRSVSAVSVYATYATLGGKEI